MAVLSKCADAITVELCVGMAMHTGMYALTGERSAEKQRCVWLRTRNPP
jgi:hypothetical protein